MEADVATTHHSTEHAEETGRLPALFTPITIKGVTFRNRLVVSPTSMFTCDAQDGLATSFHLVHLGSRALGGAGLVFTEAASVSPEGRTCLEDLGFWSDEHGEAFKPTIEFVQSRGAKMGLQLFHGGRRTSLKREERRALEPHEGGWVPIAPSPLQGHGGYPMPRPMDRDDMARLRRAYGDAASRADRFGFDVLELHACHGYLLHQFHSPLSNQRDDEYGGPWEHRVRFTLEVAEAIREQWPDDKPLFTRISTTEWVPDGWQPDEAIRLAEALVARGIDVIDVSAGGGTAFDATVEIPEGPGYLTSFSHAVRDAVGGPTCAVGLITSAELANAIIEQEQADFVNISRAFVRDPYFGLRAAEELGCPEVMPWPREYARAVADLQRFGL
jgi:2,4-dienoyl-CoA reductase-like NADH-dependent reductase (Old Yellow Enzyme family)